MAERLTLAMITAAHEFHVPLKWSTYLPSRNAAPATARASAVLVVGVFFNLASCSFRVIYQAIDAPRHYLKSSLDTGTSCGAAGIGTNA